MLAKSPPPLLRVTGFSLIEVMVAMAIGMISMLVVLQTYSASEGIKRTTTGGDDAQIAGAVALYTVERDISQSGYGVSAFSLIDCSVKLPAANGGMTVPLVPLTINSTLVPAGLPVDANTDTLLIMYGNPVGPTEGDLIQSQVGTNVYTMQSSLMYSLKDTVIAEPQVPTGSFRPAACNNLVLDTVTALPGAGSTSITVGTGAAAGTENSGILFDLGQNATIVGYAVSNGNLMNCQYLSTDCSKVTNWAPVANNISSMRALYGHDANVGDPYGIVSIWDNVPPTTACTWLKTAAVSVALVARNSEFSKTSVTLSPLHWYEPAWSGMNVNGAAVAAPGLTLTIPVTGLASGVTWDQYRYKIYTTVASLRNLATEAIPASPTC